MLLDVVEGIVFWVVRDGRVAAAAAAAPRVVSSDLLTGRRGCHSERAGEERVETSHSRTAERESRPTRV